jgi:hypothetical protein
VRIIARSPHCVTLKFEISFVSDLISKRGTEMNKNKIFGALCVSLAMCQGASAQTQVAQLTGTSQSAILEPVAQENVLRAGTEIPLLMREELTTKEKKLRTGQRFQMEVASSITKNGIVIIPAGTPAVGEITEVRNKGMWGKSGYIGARVLSLRLGDRQIRLNGTFTDKGVTGTAGVVASIALIPLAGFFTTGTSAKIPMGSGVKAFLDEDIAFRAVPAQVQAIEVPVTK